MMLLERKVEAIKRSQFFNFASQKVLEELASSTPEHQYDTNEAVIHEGDLGSSMFIVLEGHLKVHNGDKILAELKTFDFFGELAMLSSEVRLASVTALEPSVLIEVTKENLYSTMSKHQELYEEVIGVLCKRSRQMLKLEKKLSHSEKLAALGLVISGVAHELKNPLNFILNYAVFSYHTLQTILEEIQASTDERNETLKGDLVEVLGLLQKIENHSHRADTIINKLLSHTHLPGAEQEELSIPLLIKKAIELALQSFRGRHPNFHVEILENYDYEHELVKVVPNDLINVFINLLENSFYAMQERKQKDPEFTPMLNITFKAYSNEAKISFKDNGGGISQANFDKIFQPFFSTKPPGEGAGLGLSLCEDIITRQHKGNMIPNTDHCEFTEMIILLPINWDAS